MRKTLLILTALCLAQGVMAKAKANHTEFSCDERKYCKEMRSCAEAKYHLNVCGEGRLDRDNDGIPCENVCRK
ncbi:excalibur calcium-binding domain-containing protein [Aggregatibacter actinomycetemcomitans]|nr:excalibur calcium-binding domain-containing protein [Aggregatibacter actinomycetemcomitans]